MSHTPGKFIVSDLREAGKELIEICALRNDKPVCVARIDHRVNKDALDAEDEANAHLIAAAPEMLEALERIRDESGPFNLGEMRKLVEAAIREARGGE